MGLLNALKSLFRRTEAAPPTISPAFAPAGMDRPDDPEMMVQITIQSTFISFSHQETEEFHGTPEPTPAQKAGIWAMPDLERVDDDLYGITFAIEYVDAKGAATTRRITLRDLYKDGRGLTYLDCYCHERKAPRTFRFDRITTVIDADGVVHEPRTFFADELRVDLEAREPQEPFGRRQEVPIVVSAGAAQPRKTPDRSEKPGMAQRRAARDGLRVLAALARSDGAMAPGELAVILDYIKERCSRTGVPVTDADRSALAGYLKRQYPTADVLDECLARLERESVEEQRLLVRSAIALADADGVHHDAEFALLAELQQRLDAQAGVTL